MKGVEFSEPLDAVQKNDIQAWRELLAENKALRASLATSEARVRELEKDTRERFLSWRRIEEPCKKCGGSGERGYPNTTTWVGGCGGQAITSDVCDVCWGTGDTYRKGANLRDIKARIASLESDLARYKEAVGWALEHAPISMMQRDWFVVELRRRTGGGR